VPPRKCSQIGRHHAAQSGGYGAAPQSRENSLTGRPFITVYRNRSDYVLRMERGVPFYLDCE